MTYYCADAVMFSYILVFFKIDCKKSKNTSFLNVLDLVWGTQTGKK